MLSYDNILSVTAFQTFKDLSTCVARVLNGSAKVGGFNETAKFFMQIIEN